MKTLSEKNEKKLLLIICGLLSVFLAITAWQLSSIRQQFKELTEIIITPSEEPLIPEEPLIEIPTASPEPEKGFRVFGPYDSLNLSFFSRDQLGFVYQEDEKFYFNLNDQIYGPYERADSLRTAGNNVAFRYYAKDLAYLKINDVIFGPYQDVRMFNFSAEANFGFEYKENDLWYLKIDNKVYGPYEEIERVTFYLDDYVFSYKDKKDGKWYIYFNKTWKEGPYEEIDSFITSGENFAYLYRLGNDWYVKINKQEYGPYKNVTLLRLSGENFGFVWEENNQFYLKVYLVEEIKKTIE